VFALLSTLVFHNVTSSSTSILVSPRLRFKLTTRACLSLTLVCSPLPLPHRVLWLRPMP
jgi:hypothetical protein